MDAGDEFAVAERKQDSEADADQYGKGGRGAPQALAEHWHAGGKGGEHGRRL
ncbi:MAG: hypothetical protein MZV65_19335 [Chromatiales bacterium]|nr:hypothetical protein [Chromatiales bacterium]